jgi:AraC-like DNA-binding protein
MMRLHPQKRSRKFVTCRCFFVILPAVPSTVSPADIALFMSFFRTKETVASPKYRWSCQDRGTVPFVILQWTLSGEGIFESPRGIQRVPPDHAFIAVVPQNASYYYPPDAREPWTFSWLNWYGTLACELFRRFQERFGLVIPLASRGPAAASLRRLIAIAAAPGSPERSELSLQSYAFALEWWREASGPSGTSESRLARAVQFCRQHFREPLGVKEIAAEAGMSREHFTRIFVDAMKQPPATFLRRLRVDEAAALLRETELPLHEIAMRSGFYSTRHLMRAFQRVHRVGPSTYRRRPVPPRRKKRV